MAIAVWSEHENKNKDSGWAWLVSGSYAFQEGECSDQEVAQNSVLDLNFSQQNVGEDAPYKELWFPWLRFSDKNK